jgi:4a-hydroxytetrahydrobiopterin dehydratase
MSTPFTPDEIDAALAGLSGWTNAGDAITKTYELADFGAAMDFMARAAPGIDELDHHPEWTNVYNRVDVRLSSHDAGGVTERDVRLAALLDGFAEGA